jgi:integrase
MSTSDYGCLGVFTPVYYRELPKTSEFHHAAVGRLARDPRLETREARLRLPAQHEPYWRQITTGVFIGYRKGKLGGAWYARYLRSTGAYIKKRLGKADDRLDADGRIILDYKEAHRKALTIADASGRGSPGVDPRYTVSEALTDYMRLYEAQAARASIYNTRNAIETHIRPPLGELRIADLSKDQIATWHIDLVTDRRSKATANRVLNILLAVLNRAHDVGKVADPSAWRLFKKFRGVNNPRVRFLTQDECVRLVNAARPDFRPLLRAALLTGCRYGELTALTCRDYSPDASTVFVRESKTGESRHVPLNDEGGAFFDEMTVGRAGPASIFTREDGSAWQRANQQWLMTSASRRAGIEPPATFHILRHAYASFLVQRGVSLQKVAKALGHKSTAVTEKHYAHLQADDVAEAIRAHLPYFGGKKSNVTRLKKGR